MNSTEGRGCERESVRGEGGVQSVDWTTGLDYWTPSKMHSSQTAGVWEPSQFCQRQSYRQAHPPG